MRRRWDLATVISTTCQEHRQIATALTTEYPANGYAVAGYVGSFSRSYVVNGSVRLLGRARRPWLVVAAGGGGGGCCDTSCESGRGSYRGAYVVAM